MSLESVDGGAVPPGAAFVAAASGEEYFWVGSADWFDIAPLDRVWFPTAEAARGAGFRPASEHFDRLEDFDLVGEIGRGGTSIVYLARDRALGRDVAIKVIQASLREDAENIARFSQEARLLAGLRHPNIVSAFSVKQLSSGGLALVMEYIRGQTLRDVLKSEGALSIEQTDLILREIAGGLSAAHRAGIVHRDVKPDNIFLEEPTGRTLLADFGIATHLDNPTGLTMVGTAVGTPNYMSPEQIDGRALDGRSDLYSLGLVGWEMLAGVKPWAGEGLYSVIYKQKHDELPSLRDMRPDVPLRLLFAIEGALSKDPQDRWRDVDEFLASLTDDTIASKWRRWSTFAAQRRRPLKASSVGAALTGAMESVKTVRFDRNAHVPAEVPLASDPTDDVERRSTRWKRPMATAAAVVLGVAVMAFGLRESIATADQIQGDQSSGVEASERSVSLESPGVAVGTFDPLPSFGDSTDLTLESAFDLALNSDSLEVLREGMDDDGLLAPGATEDGVEADSAETPTVTPSPVEPPIVSVARSRSRVATGGMHSCGIDASAGLVCWGGNDAGQLGTAGDSRALPVALAGVGAIQGVEAGAFHTCALTADGSAVCWGENRDGQLGARDAGRDPAPVSSNRFFSLSLGTAHTCGIGSDGAAYCWGSNAYGQLGDGTRSTRSSARRVAGGAEIAVLAAGWNHTCGLTRQGEAICWGRNDGGQLGDGSTGDRSSPAAVRGGGRFTSIAAGSAHTCALTPGGQAFCWGANSDGRLGDGSTSQRTQPVPVSGSARFTEISAGGRHTCGLTSAGSAYCWGHNNYGQLGTGDTSNRSAPARVWTDIVFASIRSSGAHTCGTSRDGATYCWGYNVEGQVGDGTRTHRTVPYRVERPGATG